MTGRGILIIHNPQAGGGRRRIVEDVHQACVALGAEVESRATRCPGDAETLAREGAGEGFGTVVAAGGDGTVNEVLNGLMGVAPGAARPAMALLPAGTVNVLAAELELPREPAASAAMLVAGRRRRIDVGRANDRFFVSCAGVGADAAAVARVSLPLKRMVGRGAYAAAAVHALALEAGRLFGVEVGGQRVEASALLATNIKRYAGPCLVAPAALLDDGLLDVVLARSGGRAAWFRYGLHLLFGTLRDAPGLMHLQTRRVTVADPPGLPVQVDGDIRTHTPLAIEIIPAALELVVPAAMPVAEAP
ncbi:diacylglycerol/lipid kinase family protein [Marinimicrococcus flavescens]|uniref:YegS/Rv2252/BmrU family lipid kinase n=1 Tax=Marinimicrococcus flavescens TaxID=3031815 RepID=A0AAP3UXS3_9PROT|nr:YegS/Rv2252/BmrU family lipid kinase [Marinimicrococcus flavescens]